MLENFEKIRRQSPEIGRYFANCHDPQVKNPDRYLLYITARSRMQVDGLNSIAYEINGLEKNLLFTRFYVSYNDSL